jgi:hypothetical protein
MTTAAEISFSAEWVALTLVTLRKHSRHREEQAQKTSLTMQRIDSNPNPDFRIPNRKSGQLSM